MTKIRNLLSSTIWICFVILAILMFEFSITGVKVEPGLSFVIAIPIIVLLFGRWDKECKINYKYIVAIFFIAGIIFRSLPLILNWNYTCINDLSDTGVHYFGAQELAEGFLGDNIVTYEKMYPYLFPYTFLLSIFVRLCFGHIDCAIILSNLFFDYCGIFLLYKILHKMKGKKNAVFGMIISLVNPFSIIACWCSLNLIVVNFLLLLVITICINIIHKKANKKFLLTCFALGIAVTLANYFRPLFSVVLIAMIIILFMRYLKDRDRTLILGILVMTCTMVILSQITNRAINKIVNENVMNNTGGWNFYVGSNYESKGQWTASDRDYFFGEITPYYPADIAREMIMEKGIERYSDYSLKMFITHIANKMSVLFANEGNAIYDIRYCLGINNESALYLICSSMVSLYFALIVFGSLFSCIFKRKNDEFILLLRLLLLGFTSAFVLVEVMNRYTFIIYPVLIIITALFVDDWAELYRILKEYSRRETKLYADKS